MIDAELFRLESILALAGRGRSAAATPARPEVGRRPGRHTSDNGRNAGARVNAMVRLHEVSKVYGSGSGTTHALREVSMEVDVGELVAVMGPSGSGKSTLLTIAGTVGTTHVRAGVRRRHRRRRAGRGRRGPGCAGAPIGFVFQDFNLLAGLSAVENVALPLELDGTRARAARAAAAEMLEQARACRPGRPVPR